MIAEMSDAENDDIGICRHVREDQAKADQLRLSQGQEVQKPSAKAGIARTPKRRMAAHRADIITAIPTAPRQKPESVVRPLC